MQNKKGTLTEAKQYHRSRQFKNAISIYQSLLQQEANTEIAFLLSLAEFEMAPSDWTLKRVEQQAAKRREDASTQVNLAYAYQIVGEFDDAERSLLLALHLDSAHVEALYRLALMNRLLKHPFAIKSLHKLLQQADKLPLERQRTLFFAAGKFYQTQQQFDTAFDYYRQGNAAANVAYDLTATQQLFAAIKKVFTPSLLKRLGQASQSQATPIFIIGMPRSGSTLVERMIATCDCVFAAGELTQLPQIIHRAEIQPCSEAPFPDMLRDISPQRLQSMARVYTQEVSALCPNAKHIIDKNLFNFIYLGLITLLFPNAKIIHCRRHPLDVCLSCFFNNFIYGVEFSFTEDNLLGYYRAYDELMQFWHQRLPPIWQDCFYEQLIKAPETQTRKLFAYCELPWDQSVLHFYQQPRPVFTASLWEVHQPLYQEATFRYRHYLEHISHWQANLQQAIERYEEDFDR